MNIKEMASCERPREKMIRYGEASLSNAELLALILRTGTKEKSAIRLAEEILSLDEKGLSFLCSCTIEEIAEIKGVGPAKACQVKAAVEIGRRLSISSAGNLVHMETPQQIAALFMERMRYFTEERFHVLLLNMGGAVLSEEEIAIGDVMSISVQPREVFARAIRRGAVAIVLAHNHPSGRPEPSEDDIVTTKRLVEAGEILGIQVLDHIIIGDGKYISLKKSNLM